MEIRKYFRLCEERMPHSCKELRRTSFTLRRNGMETMEELCWAQRYSPQTIAAMRGVGEKTAAVAKTVCDLYEDSNQP
ncbi:MAG: hypothetical protein RR622_07510 [Hydrogenoanaerobacterium sp.]